MRWMLFAFLISVAALLVAAAGMVRHVILHHRQQRQTNSTPAGNFDPENDLLESDAREQ